ncbi:TlyA family RNA methyltransferase [Microbacterium aquimaris]|uniref:TlyA family RNA methyltransferase n=1 Tax=Microbacterium aquimaris TaxID=459816 RepID=A0ABU5N992_9MICO|nr:TlyA family RNA methyltransferase [Microbacterium aquimaris]MDZ8162665.1 TlyA family RNA methyltransferase [Microbacterium aquimaris]
MTVRLDAALAARGLARSRTHAAGLIGDGLVSVDGAIVVKPSTRVAESSDLTVAGADHYVSRAAHKLIAGLDTFDVDVRDRCALDMGASTGGFTQVLRERGAAPVIAVDVGHGQLDPLVAADNAVTSIEGYNVRFMDADGLRAACGVDARPAVVTGDLSFISLSLVLPAVAATIAEGGDAVLLVKPQFEVGRTAVRGGLVTDPALRAEAVGDVLWNAWDHGFGTLGVIASPLTGTHGNAEFLIHLAPDRGTNPTEWLHTISELTGAR